MRNVILFHFISALSEASKKTLIHQGGPMSPEEAEHFKNHTKFAELLQMRIWDDKAKVKGMKMEPLEKYKAMFQKYMENVPKV